MKIRGARELRGSNKGNMPFALIAVALLLTTATFCVVYANIEQKEEEAESITAELNTIDDAIAGTEDLIRTSLGNIIYDISADGNGGTLTERVKRFDSMEKSWFDSSFPRYERGFSVEIVEEDLDVDIQSMRVSSNDAVSGKSVASYLRATGTVKAVFTGTAGSATKTLNITADGTSGLPFIVDCATKFELSTEGDASMLTQLVSYQLSALAQSRIVNGYGLRSATGGMGTSDVITRADVENAFKNALSVIETICFRSNSQNDSSLISKSQIDLAEKMVLRNGYYEIDIGAILSQSLLSIIDEIVFRWIDYLSLDKIADIADRIWDKAIEILNDIISFITNNHEDNRNSARIYIKDAMSSSGYSEDDYRHVISGDRYLHISGTTIGYTVDGEYGEYSFPDFDIQIDDLDTDIIDWSGWNNYVVDYEKSRNIITEKVRENCQSLCTSVSSGYGVIRIRADEFDDISFLDSFTSAVSTSLDGCFNKLSYDMESSLRNEKVPDALLTSIYQTMVENRSSIFDEEQIREDVVKYVSFVIIKDALFSGHVGLEELFSKIIATVSESLEIDSLMREYRQNVDRIYGMFEDALTSPKNQCGSALKELVIEAGKRVLEQDFVREKVTQQAMSMMSEIKEQIRMNIGTNKVGLERLDRFTLSDGYGNLYEEFTDVVDSYNLYIDIVDPTKNSKNIHSVGIGEAKAASYVSVYTVKVTGDVNYTVHSKTGVDKSLGRFDSEFRDTLNVSMDFDIHCVSGWSLSGASYSASNNIFSDAWNALLKVLEPLLEPLKKLYEIMRDLFSACMETVIQVNAYATELIDRLYTIIMEPLERLTELISDAVSRNLCWLVENVSGIVEGFDIGASKQKITFGFFGLHLTVELRAATLLKTTKNIVKLTVEGEVGGTKFSAFIDMKKNAKDGLMIRGGGGVENGDCALDLVIDPEMKFGSKLVTLTGTIRDVDIDACLPYKEMYDEFEMALTDIPGVAEAVSNIVLPIPGYKCGFDMGIDIKYNLPLATGLMINEFESNPAGSDDGKEWVELYNATASTINLSGYVLVPESNESKAFVITGTSIGAFEKKVVMFEKQSLNNSKSGKHSGESVSLYSPEGKKVDSTPWKKDTYNDDRTWQRKADGSTSWVFIKGTPGSSNGTILKTNAIVKEFLIDCFLKAADSAFEDMGNHLKSVDDITEFLHRTLELFVKNVIDTIAEMIVSASVYIKMELMDYAQTQHYGLKVAFEMNSDLVREGIYWILKQLNILQDVVREPCCNDPVQIICENTYLTTTVYTGISTPKFLATLESEEIEVGYKAGVNITGISNMIWGEEEGKWKAVLGVVAEDLDASKLPKGLRSDKDKKCDLWLIKVELCKSDRPKTG